MNSQPSSDPTRLEPKPVFVDAQCEKHGAFQAQQIPGLFGGEPITMGCPQCSQVRQAREAQEREAERLRREQERVTALFRRSGIPARFADRTLENYRADNDGQKHALRVARRLLGTILDDAKRGASLVLCGNPGTGKTHLACAIGHALTDKLRTVQFGTVLSAVRHVKETYRRDSERTESDAINDMVAPDLLIVDEVGVQIGSEHEKMVLFEIINERYQQCRSTILISNLNQDELTTYLGERVMDRFREAGGVIAFDWTSYRGRAAA
ncbi:ATP-binding protein [Dokdonella soli]|uniref:ATP-binding protein n=1 Tax=Dokdonella soli TaxID=529810 RepID=A0ABP3TZN4_9GAMM